jgi:cytochrome c-type biogenesis protein
MATPEAPAARFTTRSMAIAGSVIVAAVVLIILSLNAGPAATFASPSGANMLILAPAAFLAGIFSFLSPCTLPILPAYFAFTFQAQRERVVMMTIAFFLGLATTMVILGASATALSRLLFSNLEIITTIGGIAIIAFGVMSILGRGFNGTQLLDRPSTSLAGSYLYGATFALGWTSCVGPILGALLTLLATQGVAVLQGAVLAFIYALGLGTPLIIVSAFFSRLGTGSPFWKFMRGRAIELNLGFTTLHIHSIGLISGIMLIAMGILLATGQLTAITTWAQQSPFAQWALGLEQWLEGVFFGSSYGG